MLIDVCIKFREYSLSGFQVIERTRFVTDRQTDRRTDRRPGKNNMSPDPKGGDIKGLITGKCFTADCLLHKISVSLYFK